MLTRLLPSHRLAASIGAAALLSLALTAPVPGLYPARVGERPQVGSAGDESAAVAAALSERAAARTAPTGSVAPGANLAAYAAAQALPSDTRTWSSVTSRPYNSDDLRYADPTASNSGAGSGYVTGRVQGLAVGGGAIYAGGAAGGVFRSTDGGHSWTPISDGLPAMSVGYLALDGDALWLATGDGTTGSGTYAGNGVWVNTSPRTSSTWTRIGAAAPTVSNGVEGTAIRKLLIAGGTAWAATSRGLYSHPTASATWASGWTRALAPCAGVGIAKVTCDVDPNYQDIANDLIVDPKAPNHMLANVVLPTSCDPRPPLGLISDHA